MALARLSGEKSAKMRGFPEFCHLLARARRKRGEKGEKEIPRPDRLLRQRWTVDCRIRPQTKRGGVSAGLSAVRGHRLRVSLRWRGIDPAIQLLGFCGACRGTLS
jgi:hypothetical protein